MLRHLVFVFVLLWGVAVHAQDEKTIVVKIVNAAEKPLSQASVTLMRTDSSLVKISITDSNGIVQFANPNLPHYLLYVSLVGYKPASQIIDAKNPRLTFALQVSDHPLDVVTVSAKKPFLELKPDRTVVNLDASVTNIGTTMMEALEKLPGVTVDKDGNISLKGRAGAKVMIDGKLTYLEGAELANLLNGMNSAEVARVELINTPPSSLDASGNAGVINIITKKGTQKGFNGTVAVAPAQGTYPKSNNSLLMNYRSGKFNFFLNYSLTARKDFTHVYALRTYYKNDGSVASYLEQPSSLNSDRLANSLRLGVDYALGEATSLNLSLMGFLQNSTSTGNNPAVWMNARSVKDSVVYTVSNNTRDLRNGQVTLGFRHSFRSSGELSADIDLIGFRNRASQTVENTSPNYSEAYRAQIPTDYRIVLGQIDYSKQFGSMKMAAGLRAKQINTDNLAAYEYNNGWNWQPDNSKSNHFLYDENVWAIYNDAETKLGKWTVQGGLRYEITNYDAKQLMKDSSFSSRFGSLFPTLFVSYETDSSNTFSFSAGRRIERVPYQSLNPFVLIINKYTYQTGNPYLRPQYSWNVEMNYAYKRFLLTSLSYNLATDYLAQIFPTDNNGIVTYSQGNFKRRQNLGASIALQLAPYSWWSFTLQAQANHKRFEGFVINGLKTARVTQYELNLNNQLRFQKGWAGEVSGNYHSAGRDDIQETLNPRGQLSLGLAKSFAQNKGMLKLTVRDVLYTDKFAGFSTFSQSTESFNISRDTRQVVLGFTWRFGKAYKTTKHLDEDADDEIQRATSKD
ncbi:outer membrane beta-barrel protein [Flavisolibacter ginsenosidimutans]|uniref:TonB-dependent receptor n=1 Tax=Flavisolibacter ginsenosidimutans TaxID=661481 RepID=A0A5B8UGA3_9BACT|nr:outer membrane beta-barrel protein [Flavisolibacter ginsenosidimutans]QEC55169.1 TonB-dependent receptor [Flavisolibacter ginsenosidimutans]